MAPFTAPGLMRAHRVATACKGEYGAIRAIANFPATPNAWPPRSELTPIAGSIPSTRSRASGAATIDPDTERLTSVAPPGRPRLKWGPSRCSLSVQDREPKVRPPHWQPACQLVARIGHRAGSQVVATGYTISVPGGQCDC